MAERLPVICGARPWESTEAGSAWKYIGMDSQEEIDMCLSCLREECVNCLAGGKCGKKGRPAKTSKETIAVYMGMGMTGREICAALGIADRTLRYYRAKMRG